MFLLGLTLQPGKSSSAEFISVKSTPCATRTYTNTNKPTSVEHHKGSVLFSPPPPTFPLQMEQAECKVSAAWALGRVARVCVWWCLAELMIHLMYMHAIQSSETYLNALSPWALGECERVNYGDGCESCAVHCHMVFMENHNPCFPYMTLCT